MSNLILNLKKQKGRQRGGGLVIALVVITSLLAVGVTGGVAWFQTTKQTSQKYTGGHMKLTLTNDGAEVTGLLEDATINPGDTGSSTLEMTAKQDGYLCLDFTITEEEGTHEQEEIDFGDTSSTTAEIADNLDVSLLVNGVEEWTGKASGLESASLTNAPFLLEDQAENTFKLVWGVATSTTQVIATDEITIDTDLILTQAHDNLEVVCD